MTPADISVVIPSLNEVGKIESCIASARDAGAQEIIVADGGSQDGTVDAAATAGADKVVHSNPGRGIQLNRGADAATGKMILFLHSDNQLGGKCLQQICDAPDAIWGAFRQRIDAPQIYYRWLEAGNALRVKLRGMPFGDQAIFVRRTDFQQGNQFVEIPLMEDYEFSRRMRKVSTPLLLHGPVTISARRWEQQGVVRQTFRNWIIQAAYGLGASPEKLAEFYRHRA